MVATASYCADGDSGPSPGVDAIHARGVGIRNHSRSTRNRRSRWSRTGHCSPYRLRHKRHRRTGRIPRPLVCAEWRTSLDYGHVWRSPLAVMQILEVILLNDAGDRRVLKLTPGAANVIT